jgi:hypothetical protein
VKITSKLGKDDFTEFEYHDANLNVEDQVRSGEIASGFEHWIATGRHGGRALHTADLTERALRAGL